MNKSKQTQENTASGEPSYITGYVRYLWLEEGLSDNTRKAYREDLQRFLDFAAERGIDVLKADLAVFHDFVYALHSMGISARSIARIVSGIRSFYHFWKSTAICRPIRPFCSRRRASGDICPPC